MDTLGLFVIAGILLYLASQSTALSNVFPDLTGTLPAAGGLMSASQIGTVASNAGFSGNDLITAIAVALAESGGNPVILGDNNQSYGLWQIYTPKHPECGPDFSALLNPQTNANCAFSIYRAAGSTFTPWTTYNQGQYLAFMPQVTAALGA